MVKLGLTRKEIDEKVVEWEKFYDNGKVEMPMPHYIAEKQLEKIKEQLKECESDLEKVN